jgi:ABC-type branched-subunit amino acid transport system ATPase component
MQRLRDNNMDDNYYESIMDRAQFLQGVYQNKVQQKEIKEKEVRNLHEEKEVLEKTEKVLKHLMDKLVQKDLSKMDNLITYGLRTVYTDRDIVFKSKIDERGKKIWIDLQTITDGKRVDPQTQSSVNVLESFLLRILCISKLKRAKLLLLDETFSAMDPGYIENFSQLIVQLCEKLGLDIFLVTHNIGFLDYAHNSYRIKRNDNKTEIIQVKSKAVPEK